MSNAEPEHKPDVETETHTDTDSTAADDPDRSHLDDVEDGCGCAEIWEHLSEQRE